MYICMYFISFVDLTALSESSIHHCECYGLQKSVRLKYINNFLIA